jgi:hypothetical protein
MLTCAEKMKLGLRTLEECHQGYIGLGFVVTVALIVLAVAFIMRGTRRPRI